MDEYKVKKLAEECNMETEEFKKIIRGIAFEHITGKKVVNKKDLDKMANALTD